MPNVRPPAVAGSFYPADADELQVLLQHCFESNPLGPRQFSTASSPVLGGLVPHAGYAYSGPCAAHLYARVDESVDRVVLIGVNHRARGHRAALSPWETWQTPLGEVRVDLELQNFIAMGVNFVSLDEKAHRDEHSIEVQLPFLQKKLQDFSFVPLSLAYLNLEECAELGAAIAAACQSAKPERRTLILASSDLSHYLPPARTIELDQIALESVLSLNAEELVRVVRENDISMCGVLATAVMISCVKHLAPRQTRLLKHCHSGDAHPMDTVVGYASLAVEL